MSNLSVVSLLLALVAVGIGGYALTQDRSDPGDLAGRLDAVEDQLSRIEARLAAQAREVERAPTLMGHTFAAESRSGTPRANDAADEDGGGDPESLSPLATADPEAGEPSAAIEELVEKAVEKKAAQMQTMRNKKPSIDVFAGTLKLTDEQREVVERDVVRAQHAIKDILEIPAEDGTNFLDELVEVMAHGMAKPGKDPGRGMKLFGRLMTEKIPGTDVTYAARVETVKQGLRESFKRNWSEEQFRTFQTWQMDPSEVQGIEGTPWKDVERRVVERAQDLGAKIPAPK